MSWLKVSSINSFVSAAIAGKFACKRGVEDLSLSEPCVELGLDEPCRDE
jgi:hypothetical protein